MIARSAARHDGRRRHLGRFIVLAFGALGTCGVSGPSLLQHRPLVVWNASASVPIGLYRVRSNTQLIRGNLVLVRPPAAVADLAAARGYVPTGVPLIKRVVATEGATICGDERSVFINGEPVAVRLEADRLGRPLPTWEGCRVLKTGELFLLMPDVPGSFDSRYFGPVGIENVIGQLVPLWIG
ncbi:conjugation peptidase TraF [Nitrospirillum amazonense]|uniref:Conjugation peptidase TraF n=1 Tax=Nitrospirillum amazonense TaxID=28077 RepID=A0A560K1K3_9PROT|nr:conjugative transfer signal peptidase TraF [Nitrospirillum amazonense]TWB77191.1 conjugation peptidase TraF [Nitrospirillum amazonense]